jgi:hypothetical protein
MHKAKVLCALLAALFAAPAAHATIWQDNSFHYWFGTSFAEPGIGTYDSSGNPTGDTNIQKQILTFTHASGYSHGGNFLNIDMLYSSPKDPVNGTGKTAINQGATEVYVVYRHNLSFNSFIASKPFDVGPISDLRFTFGADLNTKNTAFAPEKILPVGGLELAFKVPGFLTLGAFLVREWDTNGLANTAVKFDPTLRIDAAWHLNLVAGLSFQGFANVVLPKGKDGFGGDTITEVLVHPKFMYDVGTLWGDKGYEVGVGAQYWLNKFGNDHSKLPGCAEFAGFVEAAIHL